MKGTKRAKDSHKSPSVKVTTQDNSAKDSEHDLESLSMLAYQDNEISQDEAIKKPNKRRSERSLDLLTHRFVDLVMTKDDNLLDLNEAATVLKVHKRRIYDITNVLEGIGYIQKVHKNVIRWIGYMIDPQQESEISFYQKQLKKTEKQLSKLNEEIKIMNNKIMVDFLENSEAQPFLFLSQQDYSEVTKKLKGTPENPKNVLIVNAPKGTEIEIETNISPKSKKSKNQLTLKPPEDKKIKVQMFRNGELREIKPIRKERKSAGNL